MKLSTLEYDTFYNKNKGGGTQWGSWPTCKPTLP